MSSPFERDDLEHAKELIALGDFAAASAVLTRAVGSHPAGLEAQTLLGVVSLERNDLAGAQAAYLAAVQLDPLHRTSWLGLAVTLERSGNVEAADHAWREAFRECSHLASPYRGEGIPPRVLLLRSAVDGNVPLEGVLDDRFVACSTILVESFHHGTILPPHDVVFNAVGNADLPIRALDKARDVVHATNAPVINHPGNVRSTGRETVARRLRDIEGVRTPRIAAMSRHALEADDAEADVEARGLHWPLLVRAPGYHTGEHFVLIPAPSDLRAAIETLPGDDLLLIEFLDTRRSDGWFRKYRILSIDGRLYPLHLAMSREWKVHYFSGDHGAAHRRAEQAFLDRPEAVLGANAMRALKAASDVLALDYGGFDVGLEDSGRLIVFEANPTMRIAPPSSSDPDDRVAAIERAIEATRAMIARRAATR